MYKTREARVNTVAIPTTGKSCSLYQELLHPILGIPLASICKLPFIGKLPLETYAIPGTGQRVLNYF